MAVGQVVRWAEARVRSAGLHGQQGIARFSVLDPRPRYTSLTFHRPPVVRCVRIEDRRVGIEGVGHRLDRPWFKAQAMEGRPAPKHGFTIGERAPGRAFVLCLGPSGWKARVLFATPCLPANSVHRWVCKQGSRKLARVRVES